MDIKNEPTFLAVDLGTSSMKVALITVSGKVLGWESEPIKLYVTSDGGGGAIARRVVGRVPVSGEAAACAEAG